MRPRLLGAIGIALSVLGACSSPTSADPAAPSAAPGTPEPLPSAAAVVPAARAASEPSGGGDSVPLVRSAVARESGGPAPLAHDGETVVDPGATFEVELGRAVSEVRLVLLDAQDAHVAAESTREVGATTRLTLSPAAPLAAAARYVLRLEGLATRELRAADGRSFPPISFALLVAGTPAPPEPKQRRERRRAGARR